MRKIKTGLEAGDIVEVYHSKGPPEEYYFYDGGEKIVLGWAESPGLIPRLNEYFMHPVKGIPLRLIWIVDVL